MNIIETYRKSLSGLSKEVWIISTLMLINRAGLMVIPFLTIYLTKSLGFSLNQAGTAGFCFGIGSVISSYVGGAMTDKFGYDNVMKFSLVSGGLAFWTLMFITNFYAFCALVFLTAFLADLLRPAVLASMSIFSKEENRTRALSLLRMAINLGISIGPLIGGFFIEFLGYKSLFVMNGGTAILTFVIFLFVSKTMQKHDRDPIDKISSSSKDSVYSDFNYLWLLLIVFIIFTAFIQIIFLIPVYFDEVYKFSEFQVGLFFTINGLMIVIFEMPIVHYYETMRKFKKPIIIGTWLMVFAFLALLIPADQSKYIWIIPFTIYTIGISIGEIMNLPFLSSLALARTNKNNSGSYMGLFALNTSLAFTVAPIIGTRIVSMWGFSELWLFCAVLLLIAIVMFNRMSDRFLINDNYK